MYIQFTSMMKCAVILWGSVPSSLSVFRVQKYILPTLVGASSRDSCYPVFKKIKILTFPSIYIFEILKFVKFQYCSAGCGGWKVGMLSLFQNIVVIKLSIHLLIYDSFPLSTRKIDKNIFKKHCKMIYLKQHLNQLMNFSNVVSVRIILNSMVCHNDFFTVVVDRGEMK